MDIGIYRSFIEAYVKEALENSDRSNAGISEYLHSLKESGRFTSHRAERNLALAEVRKAFDDHRHWPLSIILSFLGIENKELTAKKG